MEALLYIIIAGLVIYIIWSKSQKKKEQPKPIPKSPPPKPIPEIKKDPAPPEFEESESFDLTGVHIAKRKKYILDNCQEYDDVELFRDVKNSKDPNAIGIKHNGNLIGYFAAYDLEQADEILDLNHKAYISDINYDGNYIDVVIEVEFTPKRDPRRNQNTPSEISQGELLQHMQNKIPSEHYQPKKDVKDTSSFFYGKKVCITGTLDSFPIRPELSEHLWKLGADIDSGITKKLDILICGDNPGPSKCRKAEEQGVHVMDESELIEKLDGFTSKYV